MVRIRSAQSVIVLRWRRSPLALYVASLLYALKSGILTVVLPWRIMSIGGESLAIGAVGGAWMGGYVLCCLFVGPRAERFGVRRMVMLSAATSAFTAVLMPMTASVGALLSLVAIDGALAGMMWPPITGWLSIGQEGHRLNRRLGMFSLSWALGTSVGMWMGGSLWGPRSAPYPYLAFVVASCASIGVFLVAASARKQHQSSMSARPVGKAEADETEAKKLSAFRRMAFVAGVVVGTTSGVILYSIVPLMESMSLGPKAYGQITAAMSITLMCGLFLMGRTTRWHCKRTFFWAIQIVMAAAVCAIAFSRNGWELAICYSVITSFGMAVVLASDLYYTLAGSTRRSASAAWREIRVSIGFAVGAFSGGAIIGLVSRFAGRQIGLRAVYPIMAGIIIAAVIVQAVIYFRFSRSQARDNVVEEAKRTGGKLPV